MKSVGEVTLWSIQREEAWEKAKATGALKADGRRVWSRYRPAYQWLIEQMEDRLPAASGGYPLWAWCESKPDLRETGHLISGQKGVRVEFEADAANVLLSDFEGWHSVLNGYYFSISEDDEKLMENDEVFCVWRDAENDPQRVDVIKQSWERIFDQDLLQAHVDWRGGLTLQASLGGISLDQVTHVTPFTAK